MNKLHVVLVVLDNKKIESTLKTLNFKNVVPISVITEIADAQPLTISYKGLEIPIFPFSYVRKIISKARPFIWLISGFVYNVSDIHKTKKFLVASGVPEDHIVNFEIIFHISQNWIANIRYIEKYPVDFFATGISYIEAGLNFKVFQSKYKGVNLASSNQDLHQSYLTAKHVFEHAEKGSIKFVLIGLTPYSLRYDNIKSFAVCPRNLQYVWTLQNSQDNTFHGQLLQLLISEEMKFQIMSVTAENADLNLEQTKQALNRNVPVNTLVNWQDELKNLTKDYRPETVEQNLKILKDYIELCLENDAKPIGIMFPFAPAMHDNYDQNLLSAFRKEISKLTDEYNFHFVDLFDLDLDYDCFYNMSHLNWLGSVMASSFLNLQIHERNILPFENLCFLSYEQCIFLSKILPEDEYQNLMQRIFKASIEKIRSKSKIKVGFVIYDSSMWCGDELYNCFAQNERYEVSIFLCLRTDYHADKSNNTLVEKDYRHSVEQFKSRGLNVVLVDSDAVEIPTQDEIIFLTPYLDVLPSAFHLNKITVETLTAYIPYASIISNWNVMVLPLLQIVYKNFFDTKFSLEWTKRNFPTGIAKLIYSGYPKMDVFFDDKINLHYDWKMTAPNAKKIIWAPHWSINGGVLYATFQWNYKFMLEFAKSHPEISWVVKPHPILLYSALSTGIFNSIEDFNAYLDEWNNLPNAKVETGGYYQSIFATSDGMILDSGSFIAEYQYTHKPMIFLTRDTQSFNEFGQAILKNSYTVSGDNLNGIEELIQKIFIEGKDEFFDRRLKFFEENFNYKKENGMNAGEFIFKEISKEFE